MSLGETFIIPELDMFEEFRAAEQEDAQMESLGVRDVTQAKRIAVLCVFIVFEWYHNPAVLKVKRELLPLSTAEEEKICMFFASQCAKLLQGPGGYMRLLKTRPLRREEAIRLGEFEEPDPEHFFFETDLYECQQRSGYETDGDY